MFLNNIYIIKQNMHLDTLPKSTFFVLMFYTDKISANFTQGWEGK